MNSLKAGAWSLGFLLMQAGGCSQAELAPFACNYSFLPCPDGQVESTYVKHLARVQKVTESNNLPAPYDEEFYLIELFPFGATELPSWRTLVIPCGDLPQALRQDNLPVLVSGDQMDCLFAPKSHPSIKFAGNCLFRIKAIRAVSE